MKIPLALVLASVNGVCQDPGPRSPFPRFMPEYGFHASIAAAFNATGGKKKIVVYSLPSVSLRDSVSWLEPLGR